MAVVKAGNGVVVLKAVGVKGGVYPPLKIEVVEDGEVVRVIELEDPREEYIRHWSHLESIGC